MRQAPEVAGIHKFETVHGVPEKGGIEMMGHTACARLPRSFCVDALGNYLYVAGRGDAKLGAYRISPNGTLKKKQAVPSWQVPDLIRNPFAALSIEGP